MKKRILSILLIVVLALLILPLTALAAGGLSNFTKTYVYENGHFSDVPQGQWYSSEVKLAYEFGLVNGTTPTTYSPDKNLTLAETIKLAACLHSIYQTGASTLKNGDPLWYQPYVEYALSNGIITVPYPNYLAYATRSDMAVIFTGALPDEALTPINSIADNAIPDVYMNAIYSDAVYKLYRAGILAGVDEDHSYKPNSTITRAETATIVARMASGQMRQTFAISPDASPSDSPETPETAELSITAAPSTVSVAKGAQAVVHFTVSSTDFSNLAVSIGNPATVSCTWGLPSGLDFPLKVIGLSAGATSITVKLLGADGGALAETAVSVTVTGGSGTTSNIFFPGYYPVPDYGIYAGVSPYYTEFTAINGSTFYAYRVSDIAMEIDQAVNGYKSLLMQNGFVFDSTIKSTEGDDVFVFTNSSYHLKVFLTNASRNGIPSIMVKATPF